jgi:hypothetical protein
MQSGRVLFPKDSEGGGSWFCAHENGNLVVLLNGGWLKHIPEPRYQKSRGLVLLDLADALHPVNAFKQYYLQQIEPFTLVVWQHAELFECRWDGTEKFIKRCSSHQPRIWSSVTLYDEKVRSMREQWFSAWLHEHASCNKDEVLTFHRFGGTGDRQHDLMMNRLNQVSTVSITCAEWTGNAISMHYLDLVSAQCCETLLEIKQPIGVR